MVQRSRDSLAQPEGRLRWGWLLGAVWLIYLGDPLTATLHHHPGPVRDLGVMAVLAFGGTYLVVLGLGRRHRLAGGGPQGWLAWVQVAGLVLLTLLMVPAAQQHALAALAFVAATAMFALPVRAAWAVVATLAGGAELAVSLIPGWTDTGSGLGVLLAGVAVYGIRLAFGRNRQLLETREEMAQLAVSAERSRFARDLHDILGHCLTVITVKAELAGRLVHADPARAVEQLADVERLSREALADIRGAVAGYREITLAGELAGARAALTSAGIDPDLPTAVDDVPAELRPLFAWAVREGVTNAIRHSGASRCTIRFGPNGVEIVDDGRGPTPTQTVTHPEVTSGSSHGLAGLWERAEAAGASLAVGRAGPNGGFRLCLTVEASAPRADGLPSGVGRAAPASVEPAQT